MEPRLCESGDVRDDSRRGASVAAADEPQAGAAQLLLELGPLGQIRRCNSAARDLFGDDRIASAQFLPDLLPAPAASEILRAMAQCLDSGYASGSLQLQAADQDYRFHMHRLAAATIRDEVSVLLQLQAQGADDGVSVEQWWDNLVRQHKYQSIVQLNRTLLHDINNSLATVLGYSYLALEKLKKGGSEKVEEFLAMVYEAGEKARDLVAKIQSMNCHRNWRQGGILTCAQLLSETLGLAKSSFPATVLLQTQEVDEQLVVDIEPGGVRQVLFSYILRLQAMTTKPSKVLVSLRRVTFTASHCASCGEAFSGEYALLACRELAADATAAAPSLLPAVTQAPDPVDFTLGPQMLPAIVHTYGGHCVQRQEGATTVCEFYFPLLTGDNLLLIKD